MNKNQILCTFVKQNKLLQAYEEIMRTYEVQKKLTLYYCPPLKEHIYIFSIAKVNIPLHKNTISLHKKSQYNTYYTINALNEIIKSSNNGILDTEFQINWGQYTDSLILFNIDDGLNVYNIKLIDQVYFG